VEVHDRPPAFEGSDGFAYSAGIFVDDSPDDQGRFGAAVLFVRWSATGEHPVGHLETPYLAFGETTEQAETAIRRLTLREIKRQLECVIADQKERPVW
jgi:hypothetical protein